MGLLVRFVWRVRRRAVAAVLLVSTVVAMVPAAPAVARGHRVPGIDVSTYQRRIDWEQVGRTRLRFAIVRASLGNDYVDDRYHRNVSGASAHGLVVGAYHYAKPGRARWDARAEANHFLRVARIAPGDVLPVLDIEDSGGLSRQQLWRWAKRWLTRVREATGLRAMIYSGNYFWSRYMGNTGWFGRHDYPHWVAHWYVRSPDVPGRGWGGLGWTFWQWSASGRVPGIRGPVDLDWFGGADIAASTISRVSVTPAAGGAIFGPMVDCGAGRERCTRLANPGAPITLRASAGPGSRLVRWTGDCASAGAAPTCRLTARGDLAVSAVFERAAGAASPGVPTIGWSGPPVSIGRRHCRPADVDCAIATALSRGLGSQLGEILPELLAKHGRLLGVGRSDHARRR